MLFEVTYPKTWIFCFGKDPTFMGNMLCTCLARLFVIQFRPNIPVFCVAQVLHYLTGLRPAEVAFQLFPVLLHAAVLRIKKAGWCPWNPNTYCKSHSKVPGYKPYISAHPLTNKNDIPVTSRPRN